MCVFCSRWCSHNRYLWHAKKEAHVCRCPLRQLMFLLLLLLYICSIFLGNRADNRDWQRQSAHTHKTQTICWSCACIGRRLSFLCTYFLKHCTHTHYASCIRRLCTKQPDGKLQMVHSFHKIPRFSLVNVGLSHCSFTNMFYKVSHQLWDWVHRIFCSAKSKSFK